MGFSGRDFDYTRDLCFAFRSAGLVRSGGCDPTGTFAMLLPFFPPPLLSELLILRLISSRLIMLMLDDEDAIEVIVSWQKARPTIFAADFEFFRIGVLRLYIYKLAGAKGGVSRGIRVMESSLPLLRFSPAA